MVDRQGVKTWLPINRQRCRGPVDWNDTSQREREGLDLRGAYLRTIDLSHLPLALLRGGNLVREVRKVAQLTEVALLSVAALHLEGALFHETQLVGARLNSALLNRATSPLTA
jgi:uncharacterized protein YjbI with pentapeptide repeats